MQVFKGIAEVERAVGTHLGHSKWHTITQEQVDLFADATGDHQWIHVDPQRAAEGPFGTTITHGYLTLSLLPMLVGQVYRVDDVSMVVNYGSNKVRLPSPVPVGSRVRAGVELVSMDQHSLGRLTTAKVVVEIEGANKPACIVESLAVVVP